MTISFQLPELLEASLRAAGLDPSRALLEACIVELYRQGRITQHELTQALGLARIEVDGLLKRYNVTEDLPTANEIEQEAEHLKRLTPCRE